MHYDLDDYITQVTTTQTPDVPAGSSFCVKTRTCLTWAGDNKVRILVTFAVEFTKSSWLKCEYSNIAAVFWLFFFHLLISAITSKLITPPPLKFSYH